MVKSTGATMPPPKRPPKTTSPKKTGEVDPRLLEAMRLLLKAKGQLQDMQRRVRAAGR